MRINHVILLAFLGGVSTSACATNQEDCHKNPQLGCYGGAAGTGGTSTNGTGGTMTPGTGGGGLGKACDSGADCQSGNCADGVCCDAPCDRLCEACGADGHCAVLPVGKNDPTDSKCDTLGGCGVVAGYCRCNDGVKGDGEADVDCGGVCGKCGAGAACSKSDGSECVSGFCADGVCCSAACGGPCFACDIPDSRGLCLPVAQGTPDPQCALSQVCSAQGTCANPNGGSCSSEQHCVSNRCFLSSCAGCTADAECVGGVCVNGACMNQADNGSACPADKACKSNHCVDGVCCDTECTGVCMGCHESYTGKPSGTCAPILAGYDPHNACQHPGGAASCNGMGDCGNP